MNEQCFTSPPTQIIGDTDSYLESPQDSLSYIKGVISEGQTTQTRLCSWTIVISENCLRSNRNVKRVSVLFHEPLKQFRELFQLPRNVNKYRYAYAYRATYP